MLTLDEAIKHCEEVSIKQWQESCNTSLCELEREMCKECSNEHKQLADWLKCLKEIWGHGDCNVCRNGECKWKPKPGQLVRYNCPHYVGIGCDMEVEE